MIGRVLIGGPARLLLDEPSEGVRPSIVRSICRVWRSIRDELGTTILFDGGDRDGRHEKAGADAWKDG